MATQLPRGIRLNNPGNIKKGPKWQGLAETQVDKVFATFKTPQDGLRAMSRTVMTYVTQRRARDNSPIDTLREIADRWAPPSDKNNPVAYAKIMSSTVGVPPDLEIDPLNLETMVKIMRGIVLAENGKGPKGHWFTDAELRKAARAAGIRPAPAPTKSMATTVSSLTGAGGIEQLQQGVLQAQDAVAPMAWYLEWAQWGLVGLATISAFITIYIIFFKKRGPHAEDSELAYRS